MRVTTHGHVEPLLRDLGDHDVGVVAVGGNHGGVGGLDPGLDQLVQVEPVAVHELARPVVGQPLQGLWVLVHDGHARGRPRIILMAIAEPTRPQPTISSFIAPSLSRGASGCARCRRAWSIVSAACPRSPSDCSVTAPSARPCTGCWRRARARSSASPGSPVSVAAALVRDPSRHPDAPAGLLTTDFARAARRSGDQRGGRGDGRYRAHPRPTCWSCCGPASRSSRPTSSCSPGTARSCSPRPSATACSCASRPACARRSRWSRCCASR